MQTQAHVRRLYLESLIWRRVSQRLADENVRFVEALQYYTYQARFNFECFDSMQLLSICDEVQWIARNELLRINVATVMKRLAFSSRTATRVGW